MRHIYLHGFASSPRSRKACAFQQALEAFGISVEVPDLAGGDFAHLTISGQLEIIENTLNGAPCCLIGSSMGGYLAALCAARHPEVDRLVLLAPALNFQARWQQMQGPAAIERWKETGWLDVFHYAENATIPIHYGLFEDAGKHAGFPDFRQPALIFHGNGDAVVPIDLSRQFVASHKNAKLIEMDSDHELLNVLQGITDTSVPFLTK